MPAKPLGSDREDSDGAPPDWGKIFSVGSRFIKLCLPQACGWLLFSIGASIVGSLVPQLLGVLTNQISHIAKTGTGGLVSTFMFWLLLVLAALLLNSFLKLTTVKLDVSMANEMKDALFLKMMRVEPGFYRGNDAGKINVVISRTVIDAQQLLRQIMLDPINQVISLLFTLGLMAYNFTHLNTGDAQSPAQPTNWFAIAAILAIGLTGLFFSLKLGQRLSLAARVVRNQDFALGTFVNSAFKSPEEAQAMRAETFWNSKFRSALDAMAVARRGQTLSTTLIGLAQNAPTDLMKIGLVGYAIWTILQHPASANPGSIVAIIGLVPTLMSPVQSLAAYSITVANGWPSVDTLDQIMNHPEIATERGRDSDPAAVKGLVDLENVHFTYSGTDAPILDGASFQLEPGKIYGLAARMGAGKSTLLRLLLRFFEPQSGTLRLDGRPLDEYRLEDLRTYIGYMHQFPVIFPDTVRENLRMAKPDATDAELLDVCARTGIDWRLMAKLASAIPAGGMFLDAAIQDGRLSGGETKLFALTRSLLRKPKVMLLDEPTAGMDNLEKQELIPTLQKALEAVTVLVVEHDPLWLSRLCAEIIVLDAGRVVERPTRRAAGRLRPVP